MANIDKLSQWLKQAVGVKVDAAPVPKAPQKAAPKKDKKPFVKHDRKRGGHGNKGQSKGRGGWKKGVHMDPQPKPVYAKGGKRAPVQHGVLRIIPVGGLEEVGKNCMIVEHESDILVIDMGFQFPEDEMLGVDYVIPDIQYLVERRQSIRGILITHGHLDHIGALPYVLEDLGWPTVYGSKLSLGLVKSVLERHGMLKQVKLKEVSNKDLYNFGSLSVEFFRVNHSIPDSLGMVIRSPQGSMVHTGDFKFDFTPADGIEADIGKMAEIGDKGVHVMFSDSTNAVKPGHTLSERMVAESLKKAIHGESGRVIIACFASLIGRIQQILDFAQEEGRKVFFSGGSMIRNVEIAKELGFLKFPKELVVDIRFVNDYQDHEVLVLTTGSQGEPMAALSRMASDSHAQIKIKPGDTVVLSASPIMGNEKSVAFLIDQLARLGAKLVHNGIMDVHTSGHGQQEDLKMMMTLIKPHHLVPVHGNFYMRRAHGDLAPKAGIPLERVHMMDNGNVIEIRGGKVVFKHEDIGVRFVVIDGLGQGDLGSIVQKEREVLGKNGLVSIVVKMNKGREIGKPLITTHGFVYQKEMEGIFKELEGVVTEAVAKLHKKDPRANAHSYEQFIKSAVAGFIVRRLDRTPLVVAKVMHI